MYTTFRQVYRQKNSKIMSKYYQNNFTILHNSPDNFLHEAEQVCWLWVCRPIQFLVLWKVPQEASKFLLSWKCNPRDLLWIYSLNQPVSKQQRTWSTDICYNFCTTSAHWSHRFGRPNQVKSVLWGVRTTPWPPYRTSQPQRWSQPFGNSECF